MTDTKTESLIESTSTSKTASRHQQRQQKLKEQVDKRIQAATLDKGLLLVITGNGKGKSTAGFGNVARAVGHGMTAAVVQFIKGGWDCGERNLLQQYGVQFAVMATGFTWDTQDKAADIAAAEQVWQQAERYLADPAIDMVLLDELTYMLSYHYLSLARIEQLAPELLAAAAELSAASPASELFV